MPNKENNKQKALYDALTKDGYDLGTFDSFSKNVGDETKRKALYETITKDNWDVGDYDSFSNNLVGSASSQVQMSNPLEQPLHVEVPESIRSSNGLNGSNPSPSGYELPSDFAPKSEDDKVFEENMRRFKNGEPIVGVSKQQMIDAHPELGLEGKDRGYQPTEEEVKARILNNKPGMFVNQTSSLMDKPLGNAAGDPELYGEKFDARVDSAKRYYGSDEFKNRVKKETGERVMDLVSKTDEDLKSIDEQIESHTKAIRNDDWRPGMPSVRDDHKLADLRGQRAMLNSANDLLDDSRKIVEEAGKKDSSWFTALGRGVRDKVFDVDSWTMGVTDMAGSMNLNKVLEKADKDESLTPAEQRLLDAAVTNMAVNAYYSSDLSASYKAGQVTGESIPFMLEMAVNPISASGNATAKLLLKYGLKKFGQQMGRNVGKTIGAAAGMTATTGVPGVIGGAYDRMNGQVTFGLDDKGQLTYAGRKGVMSGGEAFAKSAASRFLENHSEMVFNAFKGMGDVVWRGVQKVVPDGVNGFIQKAANTGAGKLVREFGNNELMKEVAKRTQFHGIAGEYLEEVYNNLANVPLGEMTMEQVTDLDQNIDTFLGLAPTSVFFGLLGLGSMTVERIQHRRKMDAAFGSMTDVQRKKFAELERLSKQNGNTDIRVFIKETMADPNLTKEQKRQEIEYAYDIAVNNAFDEVAEEQTVEQGEARVASQEEGAAVYATGDPVAIRESAVREDVSRSRLEEVFPDVETIARLAEADDAGRAEILDEMPEDVRDRAKAFLADYDRVQAVEDSINEAHVPEVEAAESRVSEMVRHGHVTVISLGRFGDGSHSHGVIVNGLDENGNTTVSGGLVMVVPLLNGESGPDFSSFDTMKAEALAIDPTMDRQELAPDAVIEAMLGSYQSDVEALRQDAITPGQSFVMIDSNGQPHNAQIQGQDAQGNWVVAFEDQKNPSVMPEENLRELLLEAKRTPIAAEYAAKEAAKKEAQEAAKREVMSDSYSPEVMALQPEPGEELEVNGRRASVVGVTPDGINVRYLTEKGMTSGADVIPMEDYYAYKQSLFDSSQQAQPKVQEAEVEEPKSQAELSAIPVKEDGSTDFVAYGRENTFRSLGERYGEKLPHKVEVTAKAYASDLAKMQKKLDKAQTDYDDAPIGREGKAEEALNKVRQEYDALKREADFWLGLDAEIKEAQASREAILAPQAETDTSNEPMTADEFVAQQLAAGNIVLNKENYKSETGLGDEEANSLNGGAKKLFGKDGMTIQEAGERLMEMDRENGTHFFDQDDSNAGRDALISVLSSVRNRKDLNSYIANNRAEQAKRDSEGLRNELEKQVIDAHYSSLEDYVLQMEAVEMENLFLNDRPDEIMAIFAEEAAKYKQSLNITENGQGTENEVVEGSDSVLLEEQPDDTGGIERFKNERNSERVGERSSQESEGTHASNETVSQIEKARAEVAPTPTEAQKEAGNYKKGHVRIDGYDITIENPKGGVRSGRDKNGKEWSVTMNNDYGYIRGTEAVDGDHIDVFLSDDPSTGNVFVVDQMNEDGTFDESKVMYGFSSMDEARAAYLSNYGEGWEGRIMAITEVSKEDFKKWIDSSHRKTKAFSEYKSVSRPWGDKEESRRKPLRERAREWGKALGVDVVVLESIDEVTDVDTRREIQSAHAEGAAVPGWINSDGTVYFFMPDIADVKDVDDTYIHEVVAHKGIPSLLGKERFAELCDKVWDIMPQSAKDEFMNYPGVNGNTRIAADEYIAHLAEKQNLTPEEKTVWDKILKFFRDTLDKALNGMLGKAQLTDKDLAELIRISYANLKSGAEGVSGEGTRFSAKKKRALETVSASRTKHHQTAISSADGAKVLNNLDNLAEKYENDSYTKEKTFIGYLSDAIEAVRDGSNSRYATFETKNGKVVTIRLADHNATVSNFDYKGEEEGISIVVTSDENDGIINDGNAHIVEFYYNAMKLRRADGKPLAEIVKSIKQSLYSGEYKDTTGLAERQEVNESRFRVVYHGSGVEFDKFDHSFMGIGEGNQLFGWGTYVTDVKGIGENYGTIALRGKDMFEYIGDQSVNRWVLADAKQMMDRAGGYDEMIKLYGNATLAPGTAAEQAVNFLKSTKKEDWEGQRHLYEVEIPDDNGSNYISWDKMLPKEQAERIKEAIRNSSFFKDYEKEYKRLAEERLDAWTKTNGGRAYKLLGNIVWNEKDLSQILSEAGFVGFKYPTNYMSGGNKEGTNNYVIFNEDDLKIVEHTRFRLTKEEQSIIDKAKENDTYMLAPNGEPTNLTEKQWAQVRTEAFKKWFGDWENDSANASKVVDENGEPMVVYHTSHEEWSEFDEERGYIWSWRDQERPGSSSEFGAIEYPLFMNLRNPFVFDAEYQDESDIDFSDRDGSEHDSAAGIVSWAVEQNSYDGVIIKNVKEFADRIEGNDYVAFKPNQIKSATGNEGTFDEGNNDIRFRFIGERGARNLDKAEEATTRLDNLAVAREMEAAEKDAKTIKMATGWERGADGLWRYETSDANVKEIRVKLEDGYFGIPLTEVVDDKELFNAYPELENAMFTINQRTNVPYAAGTRITMPARYIVQEGYDEAALKQVIEEEKELAKTPEFIEFKEFYQSKPNAAEMKAYEESHPVVGKYKAISQRKSSLARKYGLTEGVLVPSVYGSDFIHELQHVIQYIEGFTGGSNTSEGYDRYHRDAGEVEARNAAKRIGMTDEQRRNTLAESTEDVAREDQIFLKNGLDEGARFRFIGEKGAANLDKAEEATTRLDNLAVAREMESAEKDAKTIKMATGWERGADGLWRYEVNDNIDFDLRRPKKVELKKAYDEANEKYYKLEMRVPVRTPKNATEEERQRIKDMRKELAKLRKAMNKAFDAYYDYSAESATLGEFLGKDNQLFKEYPELADYDVSFLRDSKKLAEGLKGSFTPEYKVIWVDDARPKGDIKSTLVHEIQHAIQDIEGFVQGGTPAAFASAKYQAEDWKKTFNDFINRYGFEDWSKNLPIEDWMKYGKAYKGQFGGLHRAFIDNAVEDEDIKKSLIKELDYVKAAYDKFYQVAGGMDAAYKFKDANEWYRSLSGEVESRNVQQRMGMTDEQRRNTLAESTEDVAREDQIFLRDGIESGETRLRFVREPAIDYVSQANDVVEVPKDEVMYTMSNIAPQLYKTSGRFMRELYKYGTLGRVLKGEYAEIDQIKAKNEYDHAKPIFDEYLNELVWMKYQSTEAAQEVINKVISDVEYAMQYYKDLSLGKDVWRTHNSPRFRITEEKRKAINKAVSGFTSNYKSKPVVVLEIGMGDNELMDALDNKFKLEDIKSVIKDRKSIASYDRTIDKVIIFADRMNPDKVQKALFHENIHAATHHHNFSNLKAYFYEYAKDEPLFEKWYKLANNKNYQSYDVSEEFLAYVVSDAMIDGNLDVVAKYLGEEQKDALNKLFNEIGYDYDIRRRSSEQSNERGGTGSTSKESVLDVDGQSDSGKADGRRKGIGESEGRTLSPTERKERLIELFGKVADMGLEGVLGNESYNVLMRDVYNSLLKDVRSQIKEDAVLHYNGDFVPAMSDYLNIKGKANVWDKIVGAFKDALRRIGIDVSLTENDVKYLLWRNQKRLNPYSIIDKAADIHKQATLKVGAYADEASPTRFREKRPAIVQRYDEVIDSSSFRFQEAFQDSMLSLKVLMEAIEAESGKKAKSFENAYTAENRLSSINKIDNEKYLADFFNPLMAEIKSLSDKFGQKTVEDYIYAKSGLERNEVLKQRDADKDYAVSMEELDEKLRKGELTDNQYDALKTNAEIARTEAMAKEDDYAGLRGLLFNSKVYELDMKFERGEIDLSEYNALYDKLEEDAEEVEKGFKEYAEGLVSDFETEAGEDAVNGLWEKINAATNETLRKDYESGMMDKETYEATKNMMKYYVPLRGWSEKTAEEVYDYHHTTAPIQRNQKTAKGRRSQADNPITSIAQMAQNAIVRGNRNKMKQRLFNFVVNRPTSLATFHEGWYVKSLATGDFELEYPRIEEGDTAEDIQRKMDEFEKRMEELSKDKKAFKGKMPFGSPYRIQPKQKNEHLIPVMINGREYGIYVNGNPRAAQAVNGLTNPEASNILSEMYESAKRFYSAGLTSWNPDFLMANAVRDSIHSVTMTYLDKGPLVAARFLRDIPKSLRVIRAEIFGKGSSDPQMHQYFEEFVNFGGETGYTAIQTLEDYKKEYEKILKNLEGWEKKVQSVKNGFSAIAGWMEQANRMFEDINRFNAYQAARKSGLGIEESVDAAKNITVNFNKKGALGTTKGIWGSVAGVMSKWILFFNPTVQGITQILRSKKANPKRFNALMGVVFGSGLIVPMLNSLVVGMLGGDEEDYWLQNDYNRMNNLLLKNPLGSGYFKIPLPPTFREIYGMGDILYRVISGRISPERAAVATLRQMQLLTGFLNVIPDDEPDLGKALIGLAPDVLAPLTDVVMNQDFTGRKIAKTSDYNKHDPEYLRVYKGVSPFYVEMSRYINKMGGDDVSRAPLYGTFINPAYMEHIVTGYTGGIGKTLSNVAGIVADAVSGEFNENFDMRKVPIASRFYSVSDEATVRSAVNRKYRDYQSRYEKLNHDYKKYKDAVNDGKVQYSVELERMENSGEKAFVEYFKRKQKVLNKKLDRLKKDPDNKDLEKEITDLKAEIALKCYELLK